MNEYWKAPAVQRRYPDLVADERTSLEQWLDYHRCTLLTKCAGLTVEQLKRRAVAPSRLSLLGLVRHMVDVERWWFRMHAAGEDLAFVYDPDGVDLDFEGIDDADAVADLAAFERECGAARIAVVGRSLDDIVPSRGDHPERERDIRWVFVHMIEEYARHNGHADLLREVIDGTTGD
ncbi:MAG TPA: DinB family protein [Acidimicrobiales bacterium]|nr:DinB family protein [Acidimicrobiales bacterium]